MFPGMNPKLLKQAMKRMGVKQEEIDAKEVIIKCEDKDLIVRNPKVSKVNVMGQESLQVVGEIEEVKAEKFSETDVKVVVEKSGCSDEEAKNALEKADGDLAAAILSLQ